jgi:hypothetical protein
MFCIGSLVEPTPCGTHISVGSRVPPSLARNSSALPRMASSNSSQARSAAFMRMTITKIPQAAARQNPGQCFLIHSPFFIQNHLSPRFKRWYLRFKRWYLRN